MKYTLFLASVLIITTFIAVQLTVVEATPPEIVSIEITDEGGHLVVYVRVWNFGYVGDQYTDEVEFSVNGISDFVSVPYGPRGVVDVRYDTGLTEGPLTVQARAHCTGHGWGEWSQIIPEFSAIYLFLLLASLTFAALLLKSMACKILEVQRAPECD